MNYKLQAKATNTSTSSVCEPFRAADAILLFVIVLFSVAGTWRSLGYGGGSSEDGAMLLRYSQHLADHQGITWNAGQAPVEGATDFLYMASIAGVARIAHEDAVLACRQLLFVCCITLACIIFIATRFTLRANRWLAFALALYLASGVGGNYLRSFFGAPFMMLMVALTWWVGVAFISGRLRFTWSTSFLFSLLALLIGLTRPEGNILAVLLLLAVIYLRGLRETRKPILTFLAVFILLGGSYFVWRWQYFGYLLPNPYYVKGGGHLHLLGLIISIKNMLKILWPTLPLAALAFRNRYRTRLLLGLLIPVVGFTAIWILISPENNGLMRFQMPILPVVLLFLPLLLQDVFKELHFPAEQLSEGARVGLTIAAVTYTLACCAVFYKSFAGYLPSSAMEFASHLSLYADRGYTMAVTEAGQFPYFSRWNAIDTLGLNDATIAHHGVDEAYLDRFKPELIMYHYFTPPKTSNVATEPVYNAIRVMHSYAVHHNYILAAAYGGEPCSLNVFYVRPDTVDTKAIVDYLRNTPYYFLDTNILSVDFRNGIRPECGMLPLEVK